MEKYDVYAYGVIAPSTLYLLQDPYPVRSGYAEIAEVYRHIGGEAANSSIVLSRLGIKVKLDGNWINPDTDADIVRDVFSQNHIDISRVAFRACRGPKEMLIVDPHSRTIFGTYAQLAAEESWNCPQKIDIQNAALVSLDPFFGTASLQVAQYAETLNKPIVTVDCKFDSPLFTASTVTIIAEEYLTATYPDQSIPSLTRTYKERSRGTVIFTFGHKEILFGSREAEFRTFTPFTIHPVDTTGAGDSFRAGVIYGLLQKWPIDKSITFASAMAALVCQSVPGVLNSPSYDQVMAFIANYTPDKIPVTEPSHQRQLWTEWTTYGSRCDILLAVVQGLVPVLDRNKP